MLLVECIVGVALFSAIVIPLTARDPLGAIGDYPPAIRERCVELGLVEPRERRFSASELARKVIAMVVLAVGFALVLSRVNGDTTFWQGFRDAYVLWLAIAWWDALVVDCGWFCHSPRVRIPGTEAMPEYHDYLFHIRQSCIGSALGLPACLVVGLLVSLL